MKTHDLSGTLIAVVAIAAIALLSRPERQAPSRPPAPTAERVITRDMTDEPGTSFVPRGQSAWIRVQPGHKILITASKHCSTVVTIAVGYPAEEPAPPRPEAPKALLAGDTR